MHIYEEIKKLFTFSKFHPFSFPPPIFVCPLFQNLFPPYVSPLTSLTVSL